MAKRFAMRRFGEEEFSASSAPSARFDLVQDGDGGEEKQDDPRPVAAGGSSTSFKNARGHQSEDDTPSVSIGASVRLNVLPDERFTVADVRKTHILLRHIHGWILQVPKWRVSRVAR